MKSSVQTIWLGIDGGARSLISRSDAIQEICETVERVAPGDLSVLITGETGTGKEVVARLIHKLSGRAQFVAFDCNAVAATLLDSELFGHERGSFTGADQQHTGVFELADGGTLFLDEIGNLPLQEQPKLLRVLQEREFRRLGGHRAIRTDFRLITASNADLPSAVRTRTFRDDLYHRVRVVHLHLPPLRERREDVPLLVSYFIERKRVRLCRPNVCRVTGEAMDMLMSYDWPGNVRELENIIEIAIVQCMGDTIGPHHLCIKDVPCAGAPCRDEDLELPFREARRRALASFERLYLVALLRRNRGGVKKTALTAGITDKHVRALLKRYRIDRRDFSPALRPRSARPSERDESLAHPPGAPGRHG